MYEWMRRLEPLAPFGDLGRGFGMEVADPLWMLARQWRLGGHAGEDAGSPVGVRLPAAHVPIDPVDGQDPTVVPAEAMVEGAAEDWWTPGRRIRIGRAVAPRLGDVEPVAARFADPLPAPWRNAFVGEVDGLAAWRAGLIPAADPLVAGFAPASATTGARQRSTTPPPSPPEASSSTFPRTAVATSTGIPATPRRRTRRAPAPAR